MKSSREKFEEWFKSEHEEVENSQELSAKVMKMISWSSWQASRAAIDIELPTVIWDMSEDGSQHYDRDEVIDAIQSAGIKVKS